MRKPARIALGAIVALTLLAAGWIWLASRAPDRTEPARIEVTPGTPVRALATRLEEARVIRSARLFEIWLRASGNAGSIQAGTYAFPAGMTLSGVIEMLLGGRTLLASVTIPEGLRLEQQAGVAARQLGIDSAAFVAAATDSLFADSLGVDAPTLEGYLFPETYLVDPATDARALVRLMVGQFQRTFGEEWRRRAAELGRSVREIVTLASIVEEEARVTEERPMIAGVYWNRLRIGMKLEADPTVQYALGAHRQRVLYRDLETDSPYNTYLHAGLPPGPIASPGRASLEATLYPDSVPWLFFFATGEGGRHTFSRSFAEHNRKRRELNR
ncbi:MAG TPA: endolytic transglycosylase MltG [Gemmatimonadota bacterium]|nr:endolytic transglycosylase MltG [Gemmatimonadota bacterium]